MVKERMDLLELLRKGGMDGDVDFLREAQYSKGPEVVFHLPVRGGRGMCFIWCQMGMETWMRITGPGCDVRGLGWA